MLLSIIRAFADYRSYRRAMQEIMLLAANSRTSAWRGRTHRAAAASACATNC